MGLTSTQDTMVATHLLISVCVAGLAGAVPQLGLPAPARANQQFIVNDVVTALQPSIANAVAEALRGLQSGGSFSSSSSSSSEFSSGATGFSSGSGNTGFASGSGSTGFSAGGGSTGFSAGGGSTGFAAGSGSTGSSGGFASGATGGSADLVGATRAEYNYQFQVADDAEQTYITQNEARDGDEVTGTYSYVDPNGDLITVNYQAGPMGYTQTLDKQVGAVQITTKPVRTQAVSQAGNSGSSSFNSGSSFGSQSGSSSFNSQSGSSSGSLSGSSFGSQSGSSFGSQSGSSFGSQTGFSSTTSSSSGLDQSALIAQILSVLQPQISAAVNSAVAAQQ